MKKRWLVVALSSLMIVSGCAKDQESKPKKDEHGHDIMEAQVYQEATANRDTLPKFLEGKDEIIVLAYKSAVRTQEVLDYIPCYCGCGDSVEHKDNLDCFIKEEKKDGTVVWDDHAVTCANCVEIAIESGVMHSKGKSVSEIRKYIDETYKEGYGKPTPTEMPTT